MTEWKICVWYIALVWKYLNKLFHIKSSKEFYYKLFKPSDTPYVIFWSVILQNVKKIKWIYYKNDMSIWVIYVLTVV